jgi:hypothetical protein
MALLTVESLSNVHRCVMLRVLFSLGSSGRESKQKDGRSNGEESLDQDRHEAVSKKYAILRLNPPELTHPELLFGQR